MKTFLELYDELNEEPKGLYYNINKRKKSGTSRSKSKSTISSKSYKSMLSGFKK